MLITLSIQNFAIIDSLQIDFSGGLNVLTGETGAGKSIIVDALGLVLGARAGSEMVRTGAARASIDAVFDLTARPDLCEAASDAGFPLTDGELILSREVTSSGRSTCRILGRPATLAQLRELGESLVDMHGQHEHQSLLNAAHHIGLLDEWGGAPVLTLRKAVGERYKALQALISERHAIEADGRERVRLLDLYRFQTDEIKRAGLRVGEEEELASEHRRLANSTRLTECVEGCAAILQSDDRGVLDELAEALSLLEEAARLDPELAPLERSLRSAWLELSELERDVVRYGDRIESDPQRLDEVEQRVEFLRSLKRKYGDTIEEVIEFGRSVAERLAAVENADVRAGELDGAIAHQTAELGSLSATLTSARRAASADFESALLRELKDVSMERARFEVQIEPHQAGPTGADKVEFLISVNPGESLRPLARVASGGEVSRIMLCLKSAMGKQRMPPVMVFDEIDVGIGGRTANVVGEKLAGIAAHAQVLCITHLAQIASRAERHFSIEKVAHADHTSTRVDALTAEARVEEVARMLGGEALTPALIQHARDMLNGTHASV